MSYKLASVGVIRTTDGAFIPPDIKNIDWRDYQKWSDNNMIALMINSIKELKARIDKSGIK